MGKYIPVEPEKWAEMVKALALVKEMDKTINASQAECRRLKEKSECQAECLEAFDKEVARLKAEVERLTSENESLQAKATNIYNAMVVRCKVEEIRHKANADSIISQGMISEAMKMMEESVAIRAQVERLTKAGDAMIDEWWLQLSCPERMKASWMQEQAIVDWNAAKKGGQP